MSIKHDVSPELSGIVHCILRDIGIAVQLPIGNLPGKFDVQETAAILDLTTRRTLDTWASRCDRGGLPYVKIGRSRNYLLTDVVTFIAERRSDMQNYSLSTISTAVCNAVENLGQPDYCVGLASKALAA